MRGIVYSDDPPESEYQSDEELERAEKRRDDEADAAYDRWRETVGGAKTLPKDAEDVVYQVWQIVSDNGSGYIVNKEPIAIALVEEYVHTKVLELEAEIARLQADNDELDEVCTRRQLEVYKLQAEIAKLRDGMASDQERLKIYGDEIAKLRAENIRLKNPDMENIVNSSKLEAEIAKLRAERDKLRAALDGVIDFAEEWHGRYCEMWGERRKEQQDAMLGAILNARAALAEKV